MGMPDSNNAGFVCSFLTEENSCINMSISFNLLCMYIYLLTPTYNILTLAQIKLLQWYAIFANDIYSKTR